MGQHADDAINAMFDRMLSNDADDEDYDYTPRRTVECRSCGVGGLHWKDDNGAWRLFSTSGAAHVCSTARVHKAALDDFDVL